MSSVIVVTDHENPWMVAAHCHDKVMECGEIFMVPCQHRTLPRSRPGHHSCVNTAAKTHIRRENRVMPGRVQPCGQPSAAHILIDKNPHGRLGRSSPLARTSSASRSRSDSIRGRFSATYSSASRTASRGTP